MTIVSQSDTENDSDESRNSKVALIDQLLVDNDKLHVKINNAVEDLDKSMAGNQANILLKLFDSIHLFADFRISRLLHSNQRSSLPVTMKQIVTTLRRIDLRFRIVFQKGLRVRSS